MSTHWLLSSFTSITGIIFVDLMLSGDNALVIGTAVTTISPEQRTIALLIGGVCAAVLRILFTLFVTYLLLIPFLQLVSGILILLIALKIVIEQVPAFHSIVPAMKQSEQAQRSFISSHTFSSRQTDVLRPMSNKKSFLSTLFIIIVADISMSLDNVLAVGALAQGQTVVLIIGLSVSILLILISSAMIAKIIEKVPLLMLAAGCVLALMGTRMLWHGIHISSFIQVDYRYHIAFYCSGLLLVGLPALVVNQHYLLKKRVKYATEMKQVQEVDYHTSLPTVPTSHQREP